ncbi:MAG: hypothetical protein QMC70_01360 [Bacteroidia bacterium]
MTIGPFFALAAFKFNFVIENISSIEGEDFFRINTSKREKDI